MRFLVALFAVIVASSFVSAHPGKTDRRGGHRCLKECAEWDLYYGEYHLHDKDGKAIRVAQKKRNKPRKAPVVETVAVAPETTAPPKRDVSVQPVAAPAVPEGEPCVPSLVWALPALLLVWLLVRLRRSRGNGEP